MAKKQSPESFVQQYLSLAQAVGTKIGVAPASLLGQWGLETGWGKSVIPGTNNLGNIKDFSGQGPKAIDNLTKSTDAYRAFDTPAGFGDHYAGLLGRKYKTALNAGEDSTKFFTELKRGGYAEDAGYIQKGVQATNRVNGILGSMPARSPLQMPDESFAKQAPPPVEQAPVVMPEVPVLQPVQEEPVYDVAPVQESPMAAMESVMPRNKIVPEDLAFTIPAAPQASVSLAPTTFSWLQNRNDMATKAKANFLKSILPNLVTG